MSTPESAIPNPSPDQVLRAKLGEIVLPEVYAGIYDAYADYTLWYAEQVMHGGNEALAKIRRATARIEQPLRPSIAAQTYYPAISQVALVISRVDTDTLDPIQDTTMTVGSYDINTAHWQLARARDNQPAFTPEQANLLRMHAHYLGGHHSDL